MIADLEKTLAAEMPVELDPDALLVLAKRRRGRPPGKRSGGRKAAQAAKVGTRKFTHQTKPWNREGPLTLHLCDSVRKTLPVWSKYR